METAVDQEENVPEQEAPVQAPETPEIPARESAEEAVPEEVPAPEDASIREALPEAPAKRPHGVRAEWFLGVIALLCAALLVVMVVLCIPYFESEEDPQALIHQNHVNDAPITLPTRPPEEAEDPDGQAEPEIELAVLPEANPYGRFDFQYNRNNYLLCSRQESYPGIDVSAFQGDIDWQQVKDSGIRFAIIRLGYRGYGKAGKLVEDEYAQKNLKEAAEVGMPIGAYFFSQALSIEEADEEIEFMLKILGDHELDMPIVLDWEIPTDTARTANMDARTLTDIQLHFCQVMTEKGYTPMVYFNWYQSTHLMYLTELEAYPFWLALYQDRMTYPYKVEMWQYTDQGKVPGISGNVDINVYMPGV